MQGEWLRWRTYSQGWEKEETLSRHRVERWGGEMVSHCHSELSSEALDEWLETSARYPG